MRMRLLLYIGIVLAVVSCAPASPAIQTGDLLFQAEAGNDMAKAITDATGAEGRLNFTHVGIAIGRDSVLEASARGGVQIIPLADFLNGAGQIGGHPAVVAMRLRDTAGVAAAVERARTFIGQPYDYHYLPGNGRMYCSELVWESYRTAGGRPIFTARPMNFRTADGEIPQFWTELFRKLGEEVPEGVEGTNPNDISQEAALTEAYRWF